MEQEYFVIASLHRDDLRHRGFDTREVSDSTMTLIAYRMRASYVEHGFWQDLETIADDLNIPRKEQTDGANDV